VNTFLNKKLFILVIGHARSGTSLCAGLFSESPEIKIGLEINNLSLVRKRKKLAKNFPEELTGNKICILSDLHYYRIIECVEKRREIMHDKWKELKVIFTNRNIVSSMISKKFREAGKGKLLNFDDIVMDYAICERKIIKLKKYFNDYFVFDFDKAISSWEYVGEMFEYVKVEYKRKYFTEFKNLKNYKYGVGVSPHFVQFGMPDKFKEERLKFEQLIRLHEPWLLNG